MLRIFNKELVGRKQQHARKQQHYQYTVEQADSESDDKAYAQQ